MIETIDQLGNKLKFKIMPHRIISVVPSQTELLYDLGLENNLIGITKFCIHPEELYKSKFKVGGTKQLNLEKIKALQPDLIIANKEENDREQIEELQKHFPVWISDIFTLEDALNMINELGKLFKKETIAHKMINEINYSFSNLIKFTHSKKICYLIWNNPIMAAGKKTFINDMLIRCGFENAIQSEDSRYPVLSINNLQTYNPEVVFLSSEPYPFKKHHLEYFKKHLPNANLILVDGEMFSWYGSRLLKACNYFKIIQENLAKS